MVRMNLLSVNYKEEKNCANFAVEIQTSKVIATVCGEYIVKMEKAFNL